LRGDVNGSTRTILGCVLVLYHLAFDGLFILRGGREFEGDGDGGFNVCATYNDGPVDRVWYTGIGSSTESNLYSARFLFFL